MSANLLSSMRTGGMGTEDTAWGYDVYQEALKQGIGQELTLWDKPHWA